jgi:hypothetical protein
MYAERRRVGCTVKVTQFLGMLSAWMSFARAFKTLLARTLP